MAASRRRGGRSAFRNPSSAAASAALEERLGVRLLNRSSRRFSVTEIGQDYYDQCVAVLVEAEAAQAVIERCAPSRGASCG